MASFANLNGKKEQLRNWDTCLLLNAVNGNNNGKDLMCISKCVNFGT